MTEQQIRNCTIRLLDSKFNEFVVEMAEAKSFKATTSFLTTEQRKGWYDQELVLRFFAFKNDLASYVHEIGDFLTEYMERVSDKASDKHLVFEYENELPVKNINDVEEVVNYIKALIKISYRKILYKILH